MRDFFDFALLVVVVCMVITLAFAIVSLPFAFIGFIFLAAANVFSAGITITYISSVVVGLAALILISLFSN